MWRCEVSPKEKKANLKDGNIHTTKLVPRVSPPTLPSHSWGEKKRVPKKYVGSATTSYIHPYSSRFPSCKVFDENAPQ